LPSVGGGDCQIIDIDLAVFLFKLFQFMRCQPAHDFMIFQRDQGNKVIAAEELLEIDSTGAVLGIGINLFEGFTEGDQQSLH
jgi:hypothetical protein